MLAGKKYLVSPAQLSGPIGDTVVVGRSAGLSRLGTEHAPLYACTAIKQPPEIKVFEACKSLARQWKSPGRTRSKTAQFNGDQ